MTDKSKLILELTKAYNDSRCSDYRESLKTVLDMLESDNKGEWIPVSERLPENTDDVLVTDGDNMFIAWCITNNRFWKSYDEHYDEHTPILAWQPLPEPYKRENVSGIFKEGQIMSLEGLEEWTTKEAGKIKL